MLIDRGATDVHRLRLVSESSHYKSFAFSLGRFSPNHVGVFLVKLQVIHRGGARIHPELLSVTKLFLKGTLLSELLLGLGPILDRDFLLITLQPLLGRKNTLLHVPFSQLTGRYANTILGLFHFDDIGVILLAAGCREDSCDVEGVNLVAGFIGMQARMLVPYVNMEPRIDLVLSAGLHLESGHFIVAIIRIHVVLRTELLVRHDVCRTVFCQHSAVVPLVPHRTRAIWRKYLSLMRACPRIDTHRQLRARLCLREEFFSTIIIVIAVICTQHLGSLRFKVIVGFGTVTRRGECLHHVFAACVGLLRPWYNLACPQNEVLLGWIVSPVS